MPQPPIKKRFREVLASIVAYLPNADVERLERAFNQAMLWHGAQKRQSGEPFILHPLEVTAILAQLRLDQASLITGLLHDSIEDTEATRELVEKQFGKEVTFLVDGVTKLTRLDFHTKKEQQVQSFRKMFLAMASDIRVILVKLADRLHNIRTLTGLTSADKQLDLAQETLDIYAPIAGRLGIHWLRVELENRAFAALMPEQYREVDEFVTRYVKEQETFIHGTEERLRELMAEHDIQAKVYGRTKHYFSIFRKMQRKNLQLDQIYDIIAFRVIIQNLDQCYQALGAVHAEWRPIHGMFEDYIAMPKPNGYQSLHTNVISHYGDRMELQIRTEAMHEVAENGIAAHWRYKEGQKQGSFDANEQAQINWLRQLIEIHQEMDDPGELLESLRLNLFSGYVFVFTPQGEVIELPRDSTPIDFAFAVHTQVGLHCAGAKVNSRIVPLRYKLHNGDEVAIITNKNQRPKKEWLDFCQTSRAKNKIRHSIREEERERSRELGRELAEREFKRVELNFNRLLKSGDLDRAAQELKAKNIEEFLITLGRGGKRVSDLLRIIAPEKVELPPPEIPGLSRAAQKSKRRKSRSGIKISGIDDLLVHFGKCCNPIPGDAVAGFVTRGHGITIHRTDCSKMPREESERILEAYWDEKDDMEMPVSIKITSQDRPGILQALTEVFSKNNVNISSVQAQTVDGIGTSLFRFLVKNLDQMDTIRRKLRRVRGVLRVERVVDHRLR